MVDELQDTNQVQLELIESVARGNLFTVGDAQQSIYGFRHADVELFERRGERLAAEGARATLDANFRSRPEILDAINAAFDGPRSGDAVPAAASRAPAIRRLDEPLVELLRRRQGRGLAASRAWPRPWRLAEARGARRRGCAS